MPNKCRQSYVLNIHDACSYEASLLKLSKLILSVVVSSGKSNKTKMLRKL